MRQVARYGKFIAHPGRGPELAQILLKAAAELADLPGCQLYLVNHQVDDPDTIWVTELWRSQADLADSLRSIQGSEDVAAAMALVKEPKLVELTPLGGKGFDA